MPDATLSYADFAVLVAGWRHRLDAAGRRAGEVVALRADQSADACAALLAILLGGAIAAPFSANAAPALAESMLETAQATMLVDVPAAPDRQITTRTARPHPHPLIDRLRRQQAAGLILFSSGSTGRTKASLLNFDLLLARFDSASSPPRRTVIFLLLDHIGGVNTFLHAICTGSTLVMPRDRTPEAVCEAVEQHHAQLLPTSPTFLNLLLMSDAYRDRDLRSLELITYGTEPMPATTLSALGEAFPAVRLKQTYGLSELGILPTRSRSSDSLWMELGKQGVEHKIVDGVLWIRSPWAMLGYLNAPDPFDAEGWFNTQDMVEVDGDYLIVRGRVSEIINVGGQKVYPAEVENVILEAGNVRDVTVSGRPSPIVGQVVVARLTPSTDEDPERLRERLRRHCRDRLEDFKTPVAFEIVDGAHHSDRFKKARTLAADPAL
jgi:acyl-CoA synthetase (AMP-forming)/AMP-acid ligase II